MKGVTENETVGWYHRINGHEFEQILEVVKEEEPGRLQSMRLQSAGHNLVTKQQNTARKTLQPNT